MIKLQELNLSKKANLIIFHTDKELSDYINIYKMPKAMCIRLGAIVNDKVDNKCLEEKLPIILFAGNMDYLPNVDAVLWFYNKVILNKNNIMPKFNWIIAGSQPVRRIRKLEREPFIKVTGYINNMQAIYMKSKIFIAPLRMGRGIQTKVLEAMSNGLPCIISPLTANGLREDCLQSICIAKEPIDYCNEINKLLLDMEYYIKKAILVKECIRQYYDWQTPVNQFNDKIIEGIKEFNKLNNK